jgi:hypothetical protein
MRMHKTFFMGSAALGAAFLLVLTVDAMAQDSSSPRDKLAVWAGHWKIHIETKDTQFSHAKAEDFDAQCSFFPHGTFMFCDYLSLQPDAHDDIALLYYSDVDKTFKYTNVAQEGGPDENTMTVDGNVWTRAFKIQRRSGGTADAREIYTFVSPDKHLGRLEISIDKGVHWTVVNEAVGTRER